MFWLDPHLKELSREILRGNWAWRDAFDLD